MQSPKVPRRLRGTLSKEGIVPIHSAHTALTIYYQIRILCMMYRGRGAVLFPMFTTFEQQTIVPKCYVLRYNIHPHASRSLPLEICCCVRKIGLNIVLFTRLSVSEGRVDKCNLMVATTAGTVGKAIQKGIF